MGNQELMIAKALKELDGEDLEHLEHAETNDELEYLIAKNPNIANAVANLRRTSAMGTNISNFRAPASAATITVNIRRKLTVGAVSLTDGSGNPVYLPAPIWGVLEYENLYYRLINRYLPQDGSIVLVSVAKTSDNSGLVITYRNAADTIRETVTITTTGTPYVVMLRALAAAAFTIVQPKMRISDATKIDQFNQQIGVWYGSMWGKYSADYVVPNDYETDLIQKDNVRVLSNTFSVDPERAIVPLVAPTNAGNGQTFDLGITQYIQEFRKFAEYANK